MSNCFPILGNSAERDKIDGEQQYVTLSPGESVNLSRYS